MAFRFLSVAVMAAVLGAASVQAQSVGQVGGPANLPPSGYKGQQWVDSRGCVFLKAGYGGQTTWVPRVGRDRKAMCGVASAGSARADIEVASAADMAKPAAPVEAAPKPMVMASVEPVMPVTVVPKVDPLAVQPVYVAPVVRAAPVVRVAPAPVVVAPVVPRQPAPYVETAPRGTYETVAGSGPSRGQIGCYSSAPVAERVRTRNGGTAVVCTRGDGTMTGWRPPVYPAEAGVGAALTDPVTTGHGAGHSGYAATGGYATGYGVETYAQGAREDIPTPPKGYKLAWEDGRLNPNRGKGTASGWAAQDQVWTRKVPQELVADQPQVKRKKVVYVKRGTQVVVSTKGQPTAPVVQKKAVKVASGGAYIQVGTFGVASNADGAAARLRSAGLPVARAKTTSGGKQVQIVLAGPFGSAADAQTALSMARQAGFGDAFIR